MTSIFSNTPIFDIRHPPGYHPTYQDFSTTIDYTATEAFARERRFVPSISDVPIRDRDVFYIDGRVGHLTSRDVCNYNWGILRTLYSTPLPDGIEVLMFINDPRARVCRLEAVAYSRQHVDHIISLYSREQVDGNSNSDFYKFLDILDKHRDSYGAIRGGEHLLWDEFCNTFRIVGRNVFNHRGTDATASFYGDDLSISNNGKCIFEGPTWKLSDQPEILVKLLQDLGVSISNHPRPDMEEPQQ